MSEWAASGFVAAQVAIIAFLMMTWPVDLNAPKKKRRK